MAKKLVGNQSKIDKNKDGKISEVDFKKDYSDLTVILEKSDSFQSKKSENNLFGILKEMLGKNTNAVSLLFFFSLLLIIPGLCIPVFSQIFIISIN